MNVIEILVYTFGFFIIALIIVILAEVATQENTKVPDYKLLENACIDYFDQKIPSALADVNQYSGLGITFGVTTDIDYLNLQCCTRVSYDFNQSIPTDVGTDLKKKYGFHHCIGWNDST